MTVGSPLFAQFLEAQQASDIEQACCIAIQLVNGNYPLSLKEAARDYLEKSGPEPGLNTTAAIDNLSTFLASIEPEQNYSSPLHWLPWRALADLDSFSESSTPSAIIAHYEAHVLNTGEHALAMLQRLDIGRIRTAISPYFDHLAYQALHADMAGVSRNEALTHYVLHGGQESTRWPNRVFSNEEFFELYPWTKEVGIHPFYLFLQWPEQFSDYAQTLLGRCLAIQSTKPQAHEAKFARCRSDRTMDQPDRRVTSLVEHFSDSRKRLAVDWNRLNIHIVIPDFSEGGGGHMTIFRFVLHLERAGHSCTIWIMNYQAWRHPKGPNQSASDFYQPIQSKLLPLSSHFAFLTGDALIATGWDTVDLVKGHQGFHEKFYFVQDYEPLFFARGSEALKAEYTYQADLKTICAGPWLDGLMRRRHGKTSMQFSLSYDPEVYFPNTEGLSQDKPQRRQKLITALPSLDSRPLIRVAFYARQPTARRAVELALESLALVPQTTYRLCVELFGNPGGKTELPPGLVGREHGLLSPKQLAELYRSCDLGLTFSATNYGLVPQEMMACGLPLIEIDNESTRSVYPEDILILAKPTAQAIAEAIDRLARNGKLRTDLSQKALAWIQQTSWQNSFNSVLDFIKTELANNPATSKAEPDYRSYYLQSNHECMVKSRISSPLVSVVIPTLNGGPLLLEVIQQVLHQDIDGDFEVIMIDSASEDAVLTQLPEDPRLSVYGIPRQSFQHGRTRNLGVALAAAPYVAFLTQDALPVNSEWLRQLIQPLQENPQAVAVFGRHIGHDQHPGTIHTSLAAHFQGFSHQKYYSKFDDLPVFYQQRPSVRQHLHFYSDNNSCLRKSAWLEYPYPDVCYGEDQLWADWLIQWGYTKAYAEHAVVKHSHFYSPEDEFERARTEAMFFKRFFGYELAEDRLRLEQGLAQEVQTLLQAADPSSDPERRLALARLRARREGYQQGSREASAAMAPPAKGP